MRPVFEWFTRKQALQALMQARGAEDERAERLLARARAALAVAEKTLDPRQPTADSATAVLALFAQAVHLALAAQSGTLEPTVRDQLASAEPTILDLAAGSDEELAALRAVLERSPAETAERDEAELSADVERLRKACDALLSAVSVREAPLQKLRFQRLWRLGALALVGALLLWAAVESAALYFRGPNLLAGKSWRASSTLSDCALGESKTCRGQTVDIFFHTQEQRSPWLEYDLGAPTTFSQVTVENRSDCCKDRAVPLNVEVSDDGRNYRRVARRTRSFSTMLLRFPPVTARYLRLAVDGTTAFHLEHVAAYK